MAVKQANGVTDVTATSTNNNGGSMKANGSNSSVLGSQSTSSQDVGVFGSVVADTNDTSKAFSAGSFSYDNEAPICKKITTSLAGVATDVLRTSSDFPSMIQDPHKQLAVNELDIVVEGVKTRRQTSAVREGKWNYYTGKFDDGYPIVAVDGFFNIARATIAGDLNQDGLVDSLDASEYISSGLGDDHPGLKADNAANVTRLSPGKLAYMVGGGPVYGSNPYSNYKPKTS